MTLIFIIVILILALWSMVAGEINYWCQDQIKRIWTQHLLKKRGQAR